MIEEEPKKLEVFMERDLMTKLTVLTGYDHEISGFLTGKINEGIITLKDILIQVQEASGGEVTSDDDGLLSIIKEYKDKLKEIVGQWHSHGNMGAFFSGGDEDNNEYIMKGKEYFLFIVTGTNRDNNRPNYVAKILVNKPFKFEIPVSLNVIDNNLDKIKEEMDKIVKDKVKAIFYPKNNYIYGYGGGYEGDYVTNKSKENLKYGVNKETGKIETALDGSPWILEYVDLPDYDVSMIQEIVTDSKEFLDEVEVQVLTNGDTNQPILYDVRIDCKRKKLMKKLRRLIGDGFLEAGKDNKSRPYEYG